MSRFRITLMALAVVILASQTIRAGDSPVTQSPPGASKALVAEVLARNPDRNVQAAIYRRQIAIRERDAAFAAILKDPKRLEELEKRVGKDHVKDRLATAKKARTEIEGLTNTLRSRYADLVTDLSIDNQAPEIKVQAVVGNEVTLAALRGKVVVLDIWATWCGPCKAMIPHEREMVERLKGKPFQLVSLSIDAEVQTLKDFLAKEKMSWTHWWNGPGAWDAGTAEAWGIHAIPAIFVLDTKGIIRFKNVRGEALEKAVNELLNETATTTAAFGRAVHEVLE